MILFSEQQDANWEEECYQYGCRMAQQEALRRLSEIEERLSAFHPKDWHIEGFRKRTIVTRPRVCGDHCKEEALSG